MPRCRILAPIVKGPWLILAAAVLWSTAGAVMKSCELSGWQIAGGRSLIAGLLFLPFLPRRRPDLSILLTSFAYAATVVLFALANKLTTAANAIFLQNTAPLWVLPLSHWLLRERPERSALWSAPVFAFGLGLFFLDDLSPGQRLGNFLALGSGATFACCIVGLRKNHLAEHHLAEHHLAEHHLAPREAAEGPRDASLTALVFGNFIAALATMPFLAEGPSPHAMDLLILVYLGVFQLGLAYLCFARGVAQTSAFEASLLALLEPVLNPIWTFLVVGETPGPWALLGGSVILLATLWRAITPWLTTGRPGKDSAIRSHPQG